MWFCGMLAPANVARLFAGFANNRRLGIVVAFHGALIELQADRSPATERQDLARMPSRQRSTASFGILRISASSTSNSSQPSE
jgi:hypothetical protein